MNVRAVNDFVFARLHGRICMGKKMNTEVKVAPVGERLAGAEAAREIRVLDQILEDIKALDEVELPQVESSRPRLVLVR